MYKIQTFNNIAAAGLNCFPADEFEVGPEVTSPAGILLRSHKLHGMDVSKNLVAVARAGAGVNNIPVEDLTEHGVVVFNTPGGNANAVKELVAASLLLGSRDILGGSNYVQSLGDVNDPDDLSKRLEKEKKRFAGSEVAGKTLGVVGLGAIGAMVANLALELGMKVAGYDPAISVASAWRLSSRVLKVDSLDALVQNSDFVTLHIPANKHTQGLINADVLAKFRNGARLLNFARQQVVDIQAVIAALDSGRLSGYITDFPVPELVGRRDVVMLPHIGASTQEAEENCAVMAASQLIEFLRNGNIENSVNFPRIHMSRNGGHRITFCNRNVPAVLGTVLNVLAERKINIIDMVNKSQGEAAYNIVDVESNPSENVIREISKAEGVIRVRVV
ncbi:MAG TPA: phosphoglycerate dehydrogenase [Xanthomonadales bacterium]|nr:phosphoglycerate dehydrogenase [Xanthomonadales bacterium]